MADDLRPRGLDEAITREIGLDELPGTLRQTLEGRAQGRTVVRVGGDG
jgi:alcohol dehydrogenase